MAPPAYLGSPPVSALTGQTTTVAVQQVIQLGMFSIITFAVELLLEAGLFRMLGTLLVQLIQGEGGGGGKCGRGVLGKGRGGGLLTPPHFTVHPRWLDGLLLPATHHTPTSDITPTYPPPTPPRAPPRLSPSLYIPPHPPTPPPRLCRILHLPLPHHRLLLHD